MQKRSKAVEALTLDPGIESLCACMHPRMRHQLRKNQKADGAYIRGALDAFVRSGQMTVTTRALYTPQMVDQCVGRYRSHPSSAPAPTESRKQRFKRIDAIVRKGQPAFDTAVDVMLQRAELLGDLPTLRTTEDMIAFVEPNFKQAGLAGLDAETLRMFARSKLASLSKLKTATEQALTDQLNAALEDAETGGDGPRSPEELEAFLGAHFQQLGLPGKLELEPEALPPPPRDEVTYRIPANYWPWNGLRRYINLAKKRAEKRRDTASTFEERLIDFADSGAHFYLVGEQFLHELEETDMMTDGLKLLEEAPLPYPSFLLLLPKGYLLTPAFLEDPGMTILAAQVTLVQLDVGQALCYSYFFDTTAVDVKARSLIVPFRPDGTLVDTVDAYRSAVAAVDEPITEEDARFTLTLSNLVVKILAAMAAEPRIVESEVIESVRPAKKDKRRLEFKLPRVIGWKVRYVRYGAGHRKRAAGEPPVPHWRRRHIRRVPYGPTSVPLEQRPRRLVVVERVRVNSEYETPADAAGS